MRLTMMMRTAMGMQLTSTPTVTIARYALWLWMMSTLGFLAAADPSPTQRDLATRARPTRDLTTSARPTRDLDRGFVDPPGEARPRVYWWWLNGHATREAITRDLEELAAKGIGGVLLFDAGGPAGPAPSGPVFLSDEWRALFRHAVREAGRVGLEMSVNLCSGWDAGGPWITPDLGCRRVVWSSVTVNGPGKYSERLPLPAGVEAAHHVDVAVWAIREREGGVAPRPRVTASSSQERYPVSRVADDSDGTFWVSDGWKPGDGPTPERPEWIRCDFPEPVEASFITVVPREGYGPRTGALQVLGDGGDFETIAEFSFLDSGLARTIRFPKVRSAGFRLLITSAYTYGSAESPWNVQVSELSFDPPGRRLPGWDVKAARSPMGYTPSGVSYVPHLEPAGGDPLHGDPAKGDPAEGDPAEGDPAKGDPAKGDPAEGDPAEGDRAGGDPAGCDPASPASAPDGRAAGIPPDELVDLGGRLAPDGRLEWDAPPGRWTVLRIGHAPAGYEVKCASPGGGGLEMDWLGARAMDHHFASTALKLLEDAGPLAGKTLRYFHDDSWEVGVPNWTESFLDDFRRFRGYEARPYLPVLAGRIVGSPDISERFLHDYRKTIADCMVHNHYRRFRDLCHRHGVLLHSEGGGPCTVIAPMDALRNLGQNDVPMGEFWHSGHWKRDLQNDVGKQTSSASHTYGRRFAAAEAFTSIGPHWEEGPADLKPTADVAFCEGINRCFLHTATLSPPEAGKPGYEYFAGTHFNPNITWWEESPAWFLYLSRCQFLLAEGLPVADVCFYYGDHAPNFVAPKGVGADLGPGYDYDVCDADVLLGRLRVADGRIVLPDGVSYRLLVLPERRTIPVDVLRKLKELVEAGATILGPKPLGASGLEGWPRSDRLVRELAAEMWGPDGGAPDRGGPDGGEAGAGATAVGRIAADGSASGDSATEHRLGKGRVIRGRSPREVLRADGVGPDFAWESRDAETFLDFIHRALEGADIYFVANRRDREEEVACSFRVSGRRPELWDPVTGEIRDARAFRQAGGRTHVPLRLAPYGSIFVVFRKAIAPDAAGPGLRNWPLDGPAHAIRGPWSVRFDPALGGPGAVALEDLGDWTRHPDPGVRFYSGRATYATTFDLPRALEGGAGRIVLDLGGVGEVARVRLNGRDLGVVWTAPRRVDITDAARAGENALEIDVVNLWPNRLIGDRHLEPGERVARTNVTKFTKDSPLRSSGLLGPVTVRRLRGEE